ncbi:MULTISPECIES: hypothetical protein [unclassified Streptomyces]|uniref:hypothetical protein n=1 Tax=unclassified Streptomyces TaxID=2593676 RepID=UPI00247686B6|nr:MULTISPECIES: hypothetical protein [unclassified Streptomyces]
MELLFIGFVIFCVWAYASDKKEEKRKREVAQAEAARVARFGDPAQVGVELARMTRQGDPQRMREVVGYLPAWPVRDPLLRTAEWLAALTDNAGVAEAAGVHRDITDRVRATVEAAIAELSALAVKQVSLVRIFGSDWQALDAEIRRRLEAQTWQLGLVCSAASSLRDSLAVAVMEQRVHGGGVPAVEQDLHALADAIRQLSQGDERRF